MVRGSILLVATLLFLQGMVFAIGFSIRYNRFPSDLAELYGWVF